MTEERALAEAMKADCGASEAKWKGMKEWLMEMKLGMALEWASVMLEAQKMLWTFQTDWSGSGPCFGAIGS